MTFVDKYYRFLNIGSSSIDFKLQKVAILNSEDFAFGGF